MGDPPAAGDLLFTTRWVHLFEEDSPRGEVYAPEDNTIPRSRRQRERLQLQPDGSAIIYGPGPDDRPLPHPARWTEQEGDLVVRPETGGAPLRIIGRSPTRLVVSRRQT